MEKITLKKTISHKNKTLIIAILAGAFMALYNLSGAISYQSGILLPMPQFEKDIGFLPSTIWIYIVLYPLYLIWSLFAYKDEEQLNKTAYAFLLLTITSCACFILFPISYPRGLYPLSLDNTLTTLIFRAMRELDPPSNCLPSLHVGLCYLFAYAHIKDSRRNFLISFFLATLISASTLTTKQHYIYDILLGFILSTAIFYFFHKYTRISET